MMLRKFLVLTTVGLSLGGLGCFEPLEDPEDFFPRLSDEGVTVTSQLNSTSGVTQSASVVMIGGLEQPADIDEEASHQQARTIDLSQGANDKMSVNAFCLGTNGEIIAACGSGPGEIRVLDDSGKMLRHWSVSVKPEAVGTTKTGEILVAGEGQLFKYAADGSVLLEAEAPHVAAIRANAKELRAEAIEYLQAMSGSNTAASMRSTIEIYAQYTADFAKKKEAGTLTSDEEQMLVQLPEIMTQLKEALADAEEREANMDEESGPSDKAIDAEVERMINDKKRIASISTDNDSIFIATRAQTGYGFSVWKLNAAMQEGEEIVSGLQGCCGQMDVQACENGLFVAENSRKRVVCYDADGEEKAAWGKADRTGVNGFTSCCNPMNVCFNKNGDVFTAESNTGRIKRFSPEGELLGFVGDVNLVPGCKNVSIAVTPDNSRVYMLDITRNHIIVMEKKSDDSAQSDESATNKIDLTLLNASC